MKGNKTLEILIGMLGYIVGGMLGLWILIELVNTNKIQQGMELGILAMGYIVWIVCMNWMYIKEYIKDNPVIRRGNEWPD